MRVRTATPVLALAALLFAAPASAATTDVTVKDFGFISSNVTVAQGDTVHWHSVGTFNHTSTRSTFPTWSFALSPGGDGSRAFKQAGTYAYHCSIHASMTGTVKVPTKASPSSGTPSTTFTITVATQAADPGTTYVIQRKAPGGSYKAWKTTTARSVTFKSATKGTWSFRSKVVKVSSGKASGFSPAASVTIA